MNDLSSGSRPTAWRKAAQVCRDKLGMDYLSFISGIDWQPAPRWAATTPKATPPPRPSPPR